MSEEHAKIDIRMAARTRPAMYFGWATERGDGLRDALRSFQWQPAIGMIHVIMHRPESAGPTRLRLANLQVRKAVRECVKPALSRWLKDRPAQE